ncbi:MAG: glycosyltransferase [Anaerolineaceae bacterium]|nr:glycosyltransferase [Anaerolineaceae bacterium]
MTAELPSVSIIVPVYNGANTINICLQSLLGQHYPADLFEIIVVENGSTDNTAEVVAAYPHPVRLLRSQERGPAAARNLGIAHSDKEIVAFTDADCIAHPDWLAELVKGYTNAEIGGIGGAILPYEHADRNLYEWFAEQHPPLQNFISGDHEFLPHLYTANASYRRAVINQVDNFNPGMVTGEDVDLAWRVQLHTRLKLHYAPQAIIYHHHRSTQKGLARQYRNYGFGEILLDTLYGRYPQYPRTRGFQARRMLNQAATIPRYGLSIIIRRIRMMRGQIEQQQAALPYLLLLIESNNLRGKLDGLVATRLMTSTKRFFRSQYRSYFDRYY